MPTKVSGKWRSECLNTRYSQPTQLCDAKKIITKTILSLQYFKRKDKKNIIIHINNINGFSTSYTTAAYGSHQNVLLRLDTLGRPPSSTGSYATIASLHKFPFGKLFICDVVHLMDSCGFDSPSEELIIFIIIY